ncbi:hypothetical protein KQX54_017942 [Cotesia glomerata]|uniref:Uncharacterized protein n=1 Tax=Cotesia glomerata TaxID=32391 RepID=A0AAV7HYB2_COTGL|nr:hypothetical protein KQX54_017942 [Cotesia glomerata]
MRTLSATGSCGPSEVEDEDGDGRDGAGSASDEDSVGCSRWRPARSCPQDSSRRAADRWRNEFPAIFDAILGCYTVPASR